MRTPSKSAWVAIAALVGAVGVGGLLAQDLREGATRVAPTPARQLLIQINQRRVAKGLKPLRPDPVLASLARSHNHDMITKRFFAHDDPTGLTFEERLAYLQRRVTGEVQSWGTGGFAQPEGLFSLWMGSPSHKRTILTPSLRRGGCSLMRARFQGQERAGLATCDFSS